MVCSLQKAFECGRYRQIHVLLQVGKSNINSRDQHGRTLLMKAALVRDKQQGTELVRALIRAGADRCIVDNLGRNALFYAALYDNIAMARLLLSNIDIDVNTLDKSGSTVLHLCCGLGLYKFCKLLIPIYRKYNLAIDVTDAEGKTALHLACACGFYDIARLLVYEGKASLQRCDDKKFKNAREWLATSMKLTPNIDPFPPMTEVRRKWAAYAINCPGGITGDSNRGDKLNITSPGYMQHAKDKSRRKSSAVPVSALAEILPTRPRSAITSTSTYRSVFEEEPKQRAKTTVCLTKPKVDFKPKRTSTAKNDAGALLRSRAKSAPPKTTHARQMCTRIDDCDCSSDLMTLETTWFRELDKNNGVSQPEEHGHHSNSSFFSSNAFQGIYALYTEQASPSYRPPAVPPKNLPAYEQNSSQSSPRHGESGNTKTKIQRFIRMRRAESIIKSLKSYRGHRSPNATPRRESVAVMEYMRRTSRSEPNQLGIEKFRRRSDFKPSLRSVSSEDGFEEGYNSRGRYASVDINIIGVHQ